MHAPASPQDLRNVLLFSAIYILAAGGYSFVQGNGEFIFYIVVMLVLVVALVAAHRRVRLSRPLLWCL